MGPLAAMQDYFAGEQRGGLVLVALGLAGLIAGALLRRRAGAIARGAALPLLVVGALHAAAGGFVWVSSDRRVDRFTREIAADPAAFVDREAARMRGVSTQFQVLEVVEVVLIVGGLAGAAFARKTGRPRLAGAGLALALEAAATLGFDANAAARAHAYRDALARPPGLSHADAGPAFSQPRSSSHVVG